MNIYKVAMHTIIRKEITRFLRIWQQTLLPPVITTVLYFIIFGNLLGSRIQNMNGIKYIAFITPGLIMMSVITSSYANVVASFYGSKFQKSIEEILISPTPPWIIVFSYMIGGITRGIIVGLLVTIFSLFFTTIHLEHFFIVLVFFILTATVFSLAGLLNAIFAKKFDDTAIVPTFILTPLTYLGGVFYSVSVLPPIWQIISKINPILYMVNGFRYGFLGITDFNIYSGLAILVILSITLFQINTTLIKKGIGLRS